jgi:transcriptional regulator with XRE-family HTH domain
MATSSTVQQARQGIADRLREIRLDAELSARDLARAAGWHESKCSRIEHARTPPSDADIRAWCEICGAPVRAGDLIAASRAVESMWTEWRRLERPGLRRAQESVRPLWERTQHFRIYSPFLIPGPVQTGDYIRALLQAVRARRPNLVDDVDEAVGVRLARQNAAHDGARRFEMIVEENVLRHQIGGPAVLRDQLQYLRSVMSLPSLKVGVIPFAMYADAFTKVATTAVYEQEARTLIKTAIDAIESLACKPVHTP